MGFSIVGKNSAPPPAMYVALSANVSPLLQVMAALILRSATPSFDV